MAIIVLGSHTYEGRPGAVLASRLRKAHDIAAYHPAETIVVSGRDEAPVMATWLIDNGIDPARILVEPTATSTNENLERSLALLRSSGHPDPSRGQPCMVVTSDFHKFRTLVWAWHLGIPITVLTAVTLPPYRQLDFARELTAFPHSLARVLWRRLVAWWKRWQKT